MTITILEPKERFDYALSILLAHEGGYNNKPHDPGGKTNYGITQNDVNTYWELLKIPSDVQALTLEDAKTFYEKIWWDKYHYNAINSVLIATKIFDMAVHLGALLSHKIAQKSCNWCGHSLVVDGILGALTISALNEITQHGREEDLMMDLCDEQSNFYEVLIERHPTLKIFEKGWLNRAAWDGH